MGSNTGNRYSADMKAEIALRACRENVTVSELSSEYGVSGVQIARWKKTLTERASELFDNSKPVDIERITDPLYKEIGRLKMDIEWLKKNDEELSVCQKRGLIDPSEQEMSLRRQCELLGLSRSGYYASLKPRLENEDNEKLMKLIDRQYLVTPFYGSRRMTLWLRQQGYEVNRKRVMRLMRKMSLAGLAPGFNTSKPHPEHKVYPYLLRDIQITRVNQVWSTDITYIPMKRGFMYWTVVIDWYSRYVLSWELSNTMESAFCVRGVGWNVPEGETSAEAWQA